MKKIDLNRTINTLANIGVLVGILLLVYELNQNRQMMQAQTLIDLHLTEVNSSEVSEIFVKVDAGEPLTPVEANRYRVSWVAVFQYWANVNYQYRNGLFEDSEYAIQRTAWRGPLR